MMIAHFVSTAGTVYAYRTAEEAKLANTNLSKASIVTSKGGGTERSIQSAKHLFSLYTASSKSASSTSSTSSNSSSSSTSSSPTMPTQLHLPMDSKLYNTSLLRTVIQKAVRRRLPDTTIRAVAQTLSQLTRQTATNKNLESLLNRQVTIASEDCSQANLGLLSTCFHSLGAKLKPINRLWKSEKHGFEVAVAAVLSATSTTRDAAILTLQLSSHTPAVKFYKDTNHVANIATRLFSNDPPLDPEQIALALLLVNHACNLGGGTAWNYWREASALADHTLERNYKRRRCLVGYFKIKS